MPVKLAVVTGSNKGIGFATVKALCSNFDGVVILTARDEIRGRAAVKKLEKENLYPKFHLLDITSSESIKELATFIKHQYGGLDILVNNAGVGYLPGDPTPALEKVTHTILVNVFGTINVCRELFPLLRKHARVVHLGSSTGRLANIQSKEIQNKFLMAHSEEDLCAIMKEYIEDTKNGLQEQRGWGKCSYQISKIAITALTYIQHSRFMQDQKQDIFVNAVHPGRTRTDLVKNDGYFSPDEGAVLPVYCALLPPNTPSPRGEFVWCDKTIQSWI